MGLDSFSDAYDFDDYETRSVHSMPAFNESALSYLVQYLEDVALITSELTPLICQDICTDFIAQMAEVFGPDPATWPFALERLLSPMNLLPQVIDKNTMALNAELQKLRDKASKVLTETLFSRLLHVTDLIRIVDSTLVRHYEAAVLSQKLS